MPVKIRTEKVTRGYGKNIIKCRKILEITGCSRKESLPAEYLNDRYSPSFYRFVDGKSYKRWDVNDYGEYYNRDAYYAVNTCNNVVMCIETPKVHDLKVRQWLDRNKTPNDYVNIAEGEVILEEDFQKIVKWMKKAGERLHLINSEWSGEETVTI